jgi:hypothetical protein
MVESSYAWLNTEIKMGCGCITPYTVDLSSRCREGDILISQPLYPLEKSPLYPLNRNLGGPQGRPELGRNKMNPVSLVT